MPGLFSHARPPLVAGYGESGYNKGHDTICETEAERGG